MASQEPKPTEEDETLKAWKVDFKDDTAKPWNERTGGEKVTSVLGTTAKITLVIAMLYFFICSLSFLATGFRLVAGKQAGKVFGESEIFNNPVSGLMVGVLVTVLVQSSSTSTSICITMVGAGLLTVKQAIPIIMGANIGTSVTSTIVALGQASDRDEFRRSFAAATVHDMFNFLAVAVLLPVEAATGYLYELSTGIVDGYDSLVSQEKPPDILKVVTKPFTNAIIQIDKKIINKLAAATPGSEEYKELEAKSLLMAPKICSTEAIDATCVAADDSIAADVTACSAITDFGEDGEACEAVELTAGTCSDATALTETDCLALATPGTWTAATCTYDEGYDPEDCSDVKYLFEGMYGSWSDTAAGWLILIIALFILCVCLMGIVKMLRSLLKGRVAVWLHATVNSDLPDIKCGDNCTIPTSGIAGYLRIMAGFGLTICVQSSSITTSALTPLVGVGVIELEAMYPAVLGANIGTTVTGVLAALAADGEKLRYTLAVAYSHLFFNITGIVIFYVIWPMRKIPIGMAKTLGNVTAKYRWFPIFYIIFMFMIVPTIFVLLSMASTVLCVIVFLLIVVGIIFIATVNWMQINKKDSLPASLQSWDSLPLWMRSLEPYDKMCCCCCASPGGSKADGAAAAAAKDPEAAVASA
jgi:sodium-dependent phosphate cotransporter